MDFHIFRTAYRKAYRAALRNSKRAARRKARREAYRAALFDELRRRLYDPDETANEAFSYILARAWDVDHIRTCSLFEEFALTH